MKKQLLFLALFLSFFGIKSTAQCAVNAGEDQSVVCGSSIQLSVTPSWLPIDASTTKKLSSVSFVTADLGYIVGEGGLIIKTINGGDSWVTQTSGTTSMLNDVQFLDAETGFIVGNMGTILKTTNGGTKWNRITSGTNSNLFTVFFVNNSVGYAGGESGLVLKTVDGGTSWYRPSQEPVTAHYPCLSLFFKSADEGYAASYMGLHPKTINGGVTWEGIHPIGNYGGIGGGALNSIYFSDESTGFITLEGDGWIYRSVDGGANWTDIRPGSDFAHGYCVDFATPDMGVVVAKGGVIYGTTDKGQTWKRQSSNSSKDLYSVDFPDALTGYAVGADGTILKYSTQSTYLWSPATGLDNPTIANPTATVTGDITYTVTVTNENGCVATDDISLTVTPIIVDAGSDKTIACGSAAQLDVVATNYTGTEPLIYKWTPATGLDNDAIANPKSTVTSDIVYTVTVITEGGCEASDEVGVTVTPLIVNAGVNKRTKSGGTVQLNVAGTNFTGTGTLTYKWTPATGLSDDAIANPTATVFSSMTYTVTVSTPNGCSASDDVSVLVEAMDKPEIGVVSLSENNKNLVAWNKPASIGIESYKIYRETNITDVYELVGTVPYDSLSIYIDESSLPDVQSNKYKLSILDKNGTESPQSDYHKTMHLSINKGMGTTWNLRWEAYEGIVVSTYNIYRGTSLSNLELIGSTSGGNTQFNDLNAPDGVVYYQLEVINPNPVNPTKSPEVSQMMKVVSESAVSYNSSRSNIATNYVGSIEDIDILPNPVKDEFRIEFDGSLTFEIIDLMGKVIYTGSMNNNTVVPSGNFSSGVYVIRFNIDNSYVYKKIIKE